MADLSYGSVFQTLFDTTVETLSAGAGTLIADGQDLAGVLLLITMSMIVLLWLLSGDGVTALMDSFGVMLRFSVVSVLLLSWLATVGGFFQGAANDIGGRLATLGVSSGASTPGARVSQTVNTIMIGAGRLLASERAAPRRTCAPAETLPQTPEEALGATSEDCVTTGGAGAELSWLDMLKYFPAIMFTWLLRLVALLLMGLMVVAYLAVMILSELMFGVGITLGPILVPWLIWQRSEFLFDGWLRFMIVATLTKIVAGLMTSMMTGVILAVKTVSEKIEVRDAATLVAVDEFTALILCIVAALGTFFMWQVPGLAQALVSGGAGLTARGFGNGRTGSALRNAPSQIIQSARQLVSAHGASKASKGGTK